MKMSEIILEGRDAPLYHGTSIFHTIKILRENTIEAKTYHDNIYKNIHKNRVIQYGVSLSRVLLISLVFFGPIVFEIDQRKLAYNHKIIPNEYWQQWSKIQKKSIRSCGYGDHMTETNEAEEFCVGSIKNLDKYLLSIRMKPITLNKLTKDEANYELYKIIIDHPLLKVIT